MRTLGSLVLGIAILALPATLSSQDIIDASRSGDLERVRSLLEYNPNLVRSQDDYGRTPLHWAARGVHFEVIKLLIRSGAEVNAQDQGGVTALHSVALRGHNEAAAYLILQGAEMEARTHDGETPMSYAISYGHRAIVDLLISKGVEIDVDYVNGSGGSILHSAASGGSAALVEMVLDRGLPVNARNRYQWTALHNAAWEGHRETVELLIEAGAEIDAVDAVGKTALHHALDNGHTDIVDFLTQRGASQAAALFPVIQGEYLGQTRPGSQPELFAPGIVSSPLMEHSAPAFSSDGKELYWAVLNTEASHLAILHMQLREGQWTAPEVAQFSDWAFLDCYPFFAPDERKLYFSSRRPLENDQESSENHIWVVNRRGDNWSAPASLDATVNQKGAYAPAVTREGTLYLTSERDDGHGSADIYRSFFSQDRYQEPLNLGELINSELWDGTPYVSPDGEYLIFMSRHRPDGFGSGDLYISFQRQDGSWTSSTNMGAKINSPALDGLPMVTPDGRYLFFVSDRNGNYDVYWVDAEIIEELRPRGLKGLE